MTNLILWIVGVAVVVLLAVFGLFGLVAAFGHPAAATPTPTLAQ